MAPESERAKRETNAFLCSPCKSGSHVCFHGSCQCKCNPASWKSVEPNEPTLTCSEVVERLRQYEDLFDTIAEAWKNLPFAGVGNTLTCSADRSDIAAIDSAVEEQQKLRSTEWRERRVQELEECLRQIGTHSGDAVCDACMVLISKHSGVTYSTDSAARITSDQAAKEIRRKERE